MLIQLLFSALYTKLIESSQCEQLANEDQSASQHLQDKASICNILAEAICSIDEDNKHTDAIIALINQARESQRSSENLTDDSDEAVGLSFVSTVKVGLLIFYGA